MFAPHLAALGALVLGIVLFAWKDGYLFLSQVRTVPAGMKVEVLIRHPGIWSDFFLVNPALAYALARWGLASAANFSFTFVLSALVCAGMLVQWVAGSKTLWEPLARDGLPTIPGSIHYLYFSYVVAVVVQLAQTAEAGRDPRALCLVIAALMIHVPLGIIAPHWVTYHEVPMGNIVTTMIGEIVLAAIAARLLFFV